MRKKLVYFVMIGQWCLYMGISIYFKSIFGIIALSAIGIIGLISFLTIDPNEPPSGRERDVSWSFEG